MGVLADFLDLWDALEAVSLHPDQEYRHFSDWRQMENILPRQHMKDSLLDQPNLNIGKEFGNLGLPQSAKFSFGWLRWEDVGVQIGFRKEGSVTRLTVLFVTKNLKQLITFLWAVCLLESSSITYLHK